MQEFEYKKPLLEEADFGKFVAGASNNNDGSGDSNKGDDW